MSKKVEDKITSIRIHQSTRKEISSIRKLNESEEDCIIRIIKFFKTERDEFVDKYEEALKRIKNLEDKIGNDGK